MTSRPPADRSAPDPLPASRHARNRAAVHRGPATVLEVTGPDRTPFLQTQLPADLQRLEPGHGVYTARLDAKGRILHDIVVLEFGDRIWILSRPGRSAALAAELERFHVREDVAFADRSDLVAVGLIGPDTPELLGAVTGARLSLDPFRHAAAVVAGTEVRVIADPWTGDVGAHLVVPGDRADAVTAALREAAGGSLAELTPGDLEVLRVEGGTPLHGIDIDERTLLPELGRDAMVDHDKGCYLGQETVARVHARGRVNRLLLGLVVEGDRVPEPGTELVADGIPAGETRSAVLSPNLESVIALAMLRRHQAHPDSVVHLRIEGELVAARVAELPLYRRRGPREEAEALYRRGLGAFTQDEFAAAETLFEKAVLLNPDHVAAYESMGIARERQGRLDDAIATMEELAEIAPDYPMAWTNLSRYYAQQGKIQEAEEAKGKSMYLQMKRDAGEAAARKRSAEEEAVRRKQLEDRIGLFRQVLELDPEDVVANFGLGKILLDLGEHAEAEPRFRKAIEAQADYSMAYNHLGTCLLEEGRTGEAAEVFRAGIEVATRKGDLMPRRDMTRKLLTIEGDGNAD